LAQDHLVLDFETAARISDAAIGQALRIDPNSAVTLRAQGFAERVKGIRSGNTDHYVRAVAALSRAVAMAPGNADGWFLLGTAQSSLGRDAEALASLRKAIAIDPLNRGALTMAGVSLMNLGQTAEAEAQYLRTSELYPDYTPALLSLARLRIATGQLDAAVPPLLRARAIDDDAAAGFWLAYVYLNLGMLPEVDRTLNSIAKSPTATGIANAALMLAHGEHAALRSFALKEYAATKDPLWNNAIAMVALFTGDNATARSYFAATLPGLFLPEPRADGTPFDMMSAASALDGGGDKAQARRILKLVLAQPVPKGPVDAALVNARVNAFVGLGDHAGAIAELENAYARGYRTPYDFDMFTRIDRYPLMRPFAADQRLRVLLARIASDNA
ncbi:MAG TPA: tetratricopeptide repeat protein, partial [Polymorphobacter sp.]|nr:tetratricopeptide repeat protein [Polymorphobacter sp.]